MAKTLSNLITECRTILDEVSEADWLDSQIATEINYAYLEMYSAVIETYEDYYRTIVTTSLEANKQEYTLPSDIYKIRRIEVKYVSTDNFVKVKPYSFDQIGMGFDTLLYTSANQAIYELSGNVIRLLPIPTEDVASGLRLTYIATISNLDDSTDEVNIPFADRFATYLVLGACSKLLKKGQQEETVAKGYLLEFETGIEKMKNELENRYSDGVKMIVDTRQENTNFQSQ
jgi:hypothetical protein